MWKLTKTIPLSVVSADRVLVVAAASGALQALTKARISSGVSA